MLYSPNTDFFNIIHLSAIVRHVNYTFLHCFSTYLQLEMVISVCILIFVHIFCLCMFLINHGCSDMVCQMSCLLPWGSISLIWLKNSFLQYVYFCMHRKHFFNIMNFVGIGSHMTFLFPCNNSTHFTYTCWYLSTCSYFYIFFCQRMVGIDRGWSDIAWQMKPLIFHNGLQWYFC